MRRTVAATLVALGFAAIGAALPPSAGAAGGGSTSMPPSLPSAPEQTPAARARSAHNAGVKLLRKAEGQESAAARAQDAAKRDKSLRQSAESHRKALAKFEQAVQLDESMHEAWNYVGFAKRKLGDFAGALAAYDRALAIAPEYAEAIEYRGEAFLGLNRLEDAKQAYLTLFAANRELATKLLSAMQGWVGRQREQGTGADPQAAGEFERWVEERTRIAATTAALTREGASSGWRR